MPNDDNKDWLAGAERCNSRTYDAARDPQSIGHAMCVYGVWGHRCMMRLCPIKDRVVAYGAKKRAEKKR